MSTSLTLSNGVTVVQDTKALYKTWALSEVYLGTTGSGKYVPNVKDDVIDLDTRDVYTVSSVDQTTLVATLTAVDAAVPDDSFTTTDVLMGPGPGTQSDTYRLYVDSSVTPNAMAVDARLRINGTMAQSCTIFQGSVTDGTALPISALFDSTGNIITQAIPLETVAVPTGVNYAVKSVPPCYTTQPLSDGEIVTAVIYSTTSKVVSRRQLLVENTAFIRSSDASVKYVTGIALICPFLSDADPTLIQYPLNVLLSSLNLQGQVNYSDGTSLTLPIDGNKFTVSGLSAFLATVVGQQQPVVLKYNLSSSELALAQVNGTSRFITAAYQAITKAAQGAYSVKLYAYPVWVDAATGYALEWFMYNLDRNIYYRVTSHVKISTGTRAFNPLQYGVNQQLTVQINLNDVDGAYESYIQAQVINIILIQAGNNKGTNNWTVAFTPTQSPPYGSGVFAVSTGINANLGTIKVDCGLSTQAQWLQALYYNTLPLYDSSKESAPLVPTHFAIYSGDTLLSKQAISQWQQSFSIPLTLADLSNVDIHWTQETSTTVLELSISALQVQQSN